MTHPPRAMCSTPAPVVRHQGPPVVVVCVLYIYQMVAINSRSKISAPGVGASVQLYIMMGQCLLPPLTLSPYPIGMPACPMLLESWVPVRWMCWIPGPSPTPLALPPQAHDLACYLDPPLLGVWSPARVHWTSRPAATAYSVMHWGLTRELPLPLCPLLLVYPYLGTATITKGDAPVLYDPNPPYV